MRKPCCRCLLLSSIRLGCTAESDRDVNRGWSELTPVDASALLIIVILCYLYFITSAITILA